MVKKSVKKKAVKKKVVSKLTEDEREELVMEGELPKKSIRKSENMQLIWFFVIVALVFAAFLIPYFYIQSQKTFDYLGLEWSIEDYDELTIYHTKYPFVSKEGVVENVHNSYLRNDPRTNNISYSGGQLYFEKKVIITYSPEVLACKGQVLANSLLGQTMGGLPFVEEVVGATDDKDYAAKYNSPYATCANSTKDATVISVIKGANSKIMKQDDCYIIKVGDCKDNLLVAERFVIELIDQLDYKKL